jgi:hypothetical protein
MNDQVFGVHCSKGSLVQKCESGEFDSHTTTIKI